MEISMDEPRHGERGKAKKGGVKTMPFVIANEVCERVANYGLLSNMILYLKKEYHFTSARGATVLFLWSAFTSFTPMVGAFLSDSYLGRFHTILLGSSVGFGGLCLLCATEFFPGAQPLPCDNLKGNCESATIPQLLLLYTALALMSIGSGGIRPCSLAFGADQLNKPNDPNNEKVLQTFFNFYYAAVGISIMISLTAIIYIQNVYGWIIGFAVPAGLMLMSGLLFVLGSSFFIKIKPHKSLFVGFAQAIVAVWKNRNSDFPPQGSGCIYYHEKGSKHTRPTEKLRCMNKACIIRDPKNELTFDGAAINPWRLCTVKQVEELKSLIKVIPMWFSGIMVAVMMNQHAFPVLQATTMDRHITSTIQFPAGSFHFFALLVMSTWLIIYDKAVIPLIRLITKRSSGLTFKERMGTGLFCAWLAMVVAALVEKKRRMVAIEEGFVDNPDGVTSMTAMWLVLQQCIVGLSEAFSMIVQVHYYYSEFPKNMKSIAVALLSLQLMVGNLVGGLIVQVIDRLSRRLGNINWLDNNINRGHYDYYYWFIAALCGVNMFYYLFVVCDCCLARGDNHKIQDEARASPEEDSHKSQESPRALIK